VWWPNKDQWRDEVEGMEISVAIPNGLVDVSNGKFAGKTDLGDGYTRWDWVVHYPINNYDVSLNIGNYVHFSDRLGDLPLEIDRRHDFDQRPSVRPRGGDVEHRFGGSVHERQMAPPVEHEGRERKGRQQPLRHVFLDVRDRIGAVRIARLARSAAAAHNEHRQQRSHDEPGQRRREIRGHVTRGTCSRGCAR